MLKLPFLILAFIGISISQTALADTWQSLWFNKNQQGSQLLKQNKNTLAAQTFTDKNWKGIAYYRDGKYQEAYDEFKQDNSAQGLYNQGNALAQLGKYQEAIDAYNKSLQLEKNSPDATYNKQLIEKLLKQQQENQSQQDKDKSSKQNDENQKGQQQEKNQQQNNPRNNQSKKSQQNNTNDQQQNSNSEQNSGAKPDSNEQSDKSQQNRNQQQATQKPNNNSQSQQQSVTQQDQKGGSNKIQKEQLNQQLQDNTQAINPTTNMGKTNYMRPQTPVDKEVKSTLSQIPDDPGGLLRNKFLRDYQKQTQENK